MIMDKKAPFIAISRHRIQTDGDGVTTLCGFFGCPLRCKYCINPHSFSKNTKIIRLSPQELYDRVKIDNLYFVATDGGVTFGGGEPLLYADFIAKFRTLCGEKWRLCAETSLNVPRQFVEDAAKVIDYFYVDIKDTNPIIYRAYTGKDNKNALDNLALLLSLVSSDRVTVRLPLIQGYNTNADRENSKKLLSDMGVTKFDLFEYKIKKDATYS